MSFPVVFGSLQGRLNESPSQKEGKYLTVAEAAALARGLNESPSQKEGKCGWCRW